VSEVHDEMEFFWPSPGATAPSDAPPPAENPSPKPSTSGKTGTEPQRAVAPEGSPAIAAASSNSGGSGTPENAPESTPESAPKIPENLSDNAPTAQPPEEPEVTEAQAEELTDTIAALMEFFDAVAREEKAGPGPGALSTAAPSPGSVGEGGEKRARPEDFALDLAWDPSEDWRDPAPQDAGADGTMTLNQSRIVEAQPMPKSPGGPVANVAQADAQVDPTEPRDRRGEALDLGPLDLGPLDLGPLDLSPMDLDPSGLGDGSRPAAAAIVPPTQEEAIFSPGQKPAQGQTSAAADRPRRPKRAGANRVGGGIPWLWLIPLSIAAIVGTALWISGGSRRLLTWQTEQDIDRALARSPELAVYRIHATVRGDLLHLVGRVPSAEIRDRAVEVARQVAPDLDIDNDILILPIPPAPGQMAADASRLAAALSQQPGTAIAAALQGDTVILTGETIEGTDLNGLIQQFAAIPGVAAVTNRIAQRPLAIPQRIYFQGASAEIPPPDFTYKLGAVAAVLKRYPTHRLAVLGYSHPTENDPALGLRRAQVVRNALENLGIDRARIGVQGPSGLPPGLGANDLPWLSQSVLFQVLPPAPPAPPARSPRAPATTSGAAPGTSSGTAPASPSSPPSPVNGTNNGAGSAPPAPSVSPASVSPASASPAPISPASASPASASPAPGP
jgi:outer membrane protein OmpA-like peptidoglycan-associated protein